MSSRETEQWSGGAKRLPDSPPPLEPIASLDRQEIAIKGFMYPLEAAEKQSLFLLTAYPPSCPFCLPAGPTHLIEVHCARPVGFTFNPVLIKGRLSLLRDDPGARLVAK